jgi:hypothetical protein
MEASGVNESTPNRSGIRIEAQWAGHLYGGKMRELGISVRKSNTTQVWVHLVIDLCCTEEQLLNCYGCVIEGESFFYCC